MTALRKIDVSSLPPVAPADQAAPQLAWVEIDSLRVDDAFQRPLDKANWSAIKRIAADFRWSRFAPVLVAPMQGGLYSVLDGQHRVHAAAVCGFTSVPAMIALVPQAEQARAFIEINTAAIRVSPHQVYRAALTAGEAWAVVSRDAVEAAGCRLMTSGGNASRKRSREVYCVQLVRAMVDAGKGEAVTRALTALAAFDIAERVALWSDFVLRPWVAAVACCPGASQAALLAALNRRDPFLVIEGAAKSAEATGDPAMPLKRGAFEALILAHMGAA